MSRSVLETDPRKLRQILINLVGSAVKFTERGRVELTVEEEGGWVVFKVREGMRERTPFSPSHAPPGPCRRKSKAYEARFPMPAVTFRNRSEQRWFVYEVSPPARSIWNS
jgi:hypothetical protein